MPLLPARRGDSPRGQRSPFSDLDDMHTHMDRVFQQLLDPAAMIAEASFIPPVDVEETDDAWIVEADIPGAKRDDVNVQMQGDELVIQGEIKERERAGIIRRRTRRVGAFEFRVRLPGDVEEAGIKADLHGGVLTVRVPKARPPEARRIDITGDE